MEKLLHCHRQMEIPCSFFKTVCHWYYEMSCVTRKCASRSLSLSYRKKDLRAGPRQSFFGYDTDYKIVLCFLHKLYSVVGVSMTTTKIFRHIFLWHFSNMVYCTSSHVMYHSRVLTQHFYLNVNLGQILISSSCLKWVSRFNGYNYTCSDPNFYELVFIKDFFLWIRDLCWHLEKYMINVIVKQRIWRFSKQLDSACKLEFLWLDCLQMVPTRVSGAYYSSINSH